MSITCLGKIMMSAVVLVSVSADCSFGKEPITRHQVNTRSTKGVSTNVLGKEFQRLITETSDPVLVDFWAPWCGPCRKLSPTIDKIADKFRDDVIVVKVNIADARQLANKYRVKTIPTLLIIHNQKLVKRMSGMQSEKSLSTHLKATIAQSDKSTAL